ncbi:hypothetical protein NQZ68_037752 [Dissostichus eleginoides]|nr:hypothetical protein NQZ68_037752 [Dissostichus eleginoides]
MRGCINTGAKSNLFTVTGRIDPLGPGVSRVTVCRRLTLPTVVTASNLTDVPLPQARATSSAPIAVEKCPDVTQKLPGCQHWPDDLIMCHTLVGKVSRSRVGLTAQKNDCLQSSAAASQNTASAEKSVASLV